MARLTVGLSVLLAFVGAASAEPLPGDPEAGERLARAWCAECHEVERGSHEQPWLDVPPFQALADDPAVTETALRVFFRMPHRNMPDIRLDAAQTNDLIAYILALRDHRGT
jgi:mono/diheme cytochrome c family protein